MSAASAKAKAEETAPQRACHVVWFGSIMYSVFDSKGSRPKKISGKLGILSQPA